MALVRRKHRRLLAKIGLALLVLLITGEVASWIISRSMFSLLDVFKLEKPNIEFNDPEALHVLCVGDSYTYGDGSQRQSRKFFGYPEILGRILVKPDKSAGAEVVNLGVPGYSSAGTLKRLRKFLTRSKTDPDVVLIAVGMNNIGHWGFFQCLSRDESYQASWFDRVRFFIGTRSFWSKFLVSLLVAFDTDLPPFMTYPKKFRLDDQGQMQWHDPADREIVEQCLREDYGKIVQLAQSVGAEPILLTYHRGWFITDVQKEFAEQTGIPLIDVARHASACKQSPWQEYSGMSDWHPDLSGYLAIAYFVAEELAAHPLGQQHELKVVPYRRIAPLIQEILKPEAAPDFIVPCELAV